MARGDGRHEDRLGGATMPYARLLELPSRIRASTA